MLIIILFCSMSIQNVAALDVRYPIWNTRVRFPQKINSDQQCPCDYPRILTRRADTAGRKSQYSTFSHGSSNRTTVSNRSVFSNASQYDSAMSESSYEDSRYGSNVQLEPVERGSRTGSRQGDHPVKGAQSPFARALAKMENAGARIIATRLSEEWEGLDDDESYQEVIFEKRLWALTAYQRLTQNKQLQSPAHELLSSSRPADQRRILHLHGSLGTFLGSALVAAHTDLHS
jgi:hypothetical protein